MIIKFKLHEIYSPLHWFSVYIEPEISLGSSRTHGGESQGHARESKVNRQKQLKRATNYCVSFTRANVFVTAGTAIYAYTKFILNDYVSDRLVNSTYFTITPVWPSYVTYSFLSNHCTIQQIISTSTTMSVFLTILLDLPPIATTSSSITTLHPTSKATFISTVCQEHSIVCLYLT